MVKAHLNIFANDLHDLQVELFDRGCRQVDMTQQAVDDLQQGLLHAGKAFLQQLREKRDPHITGLISP